MLSPLFGIIVNRPSANNIVADGRRIRDDFHASFHPRRSRGTMGNGSGKGLRSHEIGYVAIAFVSPLRGIMARREGEEREENAKG